MNDGLNSYDVPVFRAGMSPYFAHLIYPADVPSAYVAAVQRAIGLLVWSLRKWEQHQRTPQGSARALLRLIAQDTEGRGRWRAVGE